MKTMSSTSLAVLQMLLQNDDARKIPLIPGVEDNGKLKATRKKKKKSSRNNKLGFPDIGNESSAAA